MAASYHTSLLTATDCRSHVHLIIGTNSLAGKRCEQSLATGARPILIAPEATSEGQSVHYGITKLAESGQVTWLRQPFTDDLLSSLGRDEVGGVVDAVFVTSSAGAVSAQHISALCRRNRIPVNVVDSPALCTFTILSTHTDGPLQVGITTNGRGCHLASRIRREVAALLPHNLGTACARLGEVRSRIQEEDHLLHEALATGGIGGLVDEEGMDQTASFNKLVTEEDLDAMKSRRMRWLAQVCEYWPLKRLAAISDEDVEAVLKSYPGGNASIDTSRPEGDAGTITSPPATTTPSRRGKIILAGSGPGHPDLLTRATHKAIQSADLILADKLVPSGVLDLIPRRTPVAIARKFPGNADQAQEEFLEQALAGVKLGKTVLRLKQGDPFIYGRGGEEVEYFRRHGLGDRVTVLPGITSSLSAPLFAAIPPTQRDVADQVLVCTGTGKKGKPPTPPEFVGSRTCVFLMALHRIGGLVAELTQHLPSELEQPTTTTTTTTTSAPIPNSDDPAEDVVHQMIETTPVSAAGGRTKPTRSLWPKATPCAVIERASCPDQRVIRTTLEFVAQAIEAEGSRPPGLLVVGRACEALYAPESGTSWTVEEGFKGLDVDEVGEGVAAGLAGVGA
ncbi:Uroporphyrinogen-III C-methyltransferase [Cytospora mali]|uniref:precorrin-2 dehydrogenase n=1 Tax=Cytospora mali TaxID=578113 RepID=A0A194WAJ3_CYTMA|nr:Uroporphyrinogen-III C-methyltransferase [Valsa mali]